MKDVVYVRQKMHNSNQQIQMQGTGLGLTSEDWHMCVHLCFKLYRVFMVCMNHFFFFYHFPLYPTCRKTNCQSWWRGKRQLVPGHFLASILLLSTLWTSLFHYAFWINGSCIFVLSSQNPVYFVLNKPHFLPEIIAYPAALFTEEYLLAQTRRI